MAKEFTLGKTERLKSRKAIDELFKTGKRFSVSPYSVVFSISKNSGLQFGIGVSTRNFKKAVDRNRVKRLTREVWRLQKNAIQDMLKEKGLGLNVFFNYTEKELPNYSFLYAQVEKIIKKLSATIYENGA